MHFLKYSNEPQINQDFYCIWYSADREQKSRASGYIGKGEWGKRRDTLRCSHCCLVLYSITGSSSPHILAMVWRNQLRDPSVKDPELNAKSSEFSVWVKTARLDLRLLIPNFNKESDKGSYLTTYESHYSELRTIFSSISIWYNCQRDITTNTQKHSLTCSRSFNSSFMYKLAEVSSRKNLPEKHLWPQLIQKSECLEREKKYGSHQGYIHADWGQLYNML